jgi:hypothetical protein
MSDNVYIMKEHVGDFEHSDLDFHLHKRFGFDYDIHSEFVELEKGQGEVFYNEPIDIDVLLKSINELKSRGATHISLDYHCDHIAYEMSGYRITEAEPALVEAYEETKRKDLEKAQKIMELKKQIADIERDSQPETLITEADDLPF